MQRPNIKKINNKGTVVGVVAIIVAVVLSVFAAGALIMWNNNRQPGATGGGAGVGQYDYTGKNVEFLLKSSNKYTAAAVDPTFYLYDSEPAHWGNGRQSLADGYISSATSSSGTATLTELPGKYWVRGILSGYYDDFFTVTVPSSGDVPLSQYNDGGEEIQKVQLIDVETLSVSNVDFGIATNETADKTYTKWGHFAVDDNEGFCLAAVKFREDATYAFATDTDGDDIYDEGINKIVVSGDIPKTTLFDVGNSIDLFGGDSEHVIDIDSQLFEENTNLNMKFEVTCDLTLTATGDADEKCGDGEDFLDDVVLVDCAGNTATYHLVG